MSTTIETPNTITINNFVSLALCLTDEQVKDYQQGKSVPDSAVMTDCQRGIHIGRYGEDRDTASFYWVGATNAEQQMMLACGFGAKVSTHMNYLEDPDYISLLFMESARSKTFPSRQIKDTFFVPPEKLAKECVQTVAEVQEFMLFAAACYKHAPHVIDAMRDTGDLSCFQSNRSIITDMWTQARHEDGLEKPIDKQLEALRF